MSHHPLTLKAHALLSQTAVLDIELLETLTLIVKGNVHRAEACEDPRTYCVKRLGMSDDSAYRRLYSADLLDRYPHLVRPLIESREIHLTGLAFLHRVISDENAAALLDEARGKTKAEIEEIVCRIKPRAVVTASVKRVAAKQISKAPSLPLVLTASEQSSPEKENVSAPSSEAVASACDAAPGSRVPNVRPLDAFTHRFTCMMTETTNASLDTARDLFPDADLNAIFANAIDTLVERTMMKNRRVLKQTRAASVRAEKEEASAVHVEALVATAVEGKGGRDDGSDGRGKGAGKDSGLGSGSAKREDSAPQGRNRNRTGAETTGNTAGRVTGDTPSEATLAVGPVGNTRYITAAIARAVFVRDNNQCQFEDANRNQCCSKRYLQLHHLDPWARGGATTIANLKVYCRSHNLYQAELDFGPRSAA